MNKASVARAARFPLAIAVAASGVLVALASPSSAAQIGSLAFNSLSTQDTAFTVTTSAGCPQTPTKATNFLINIAGGDLPVVSPPANITGNTSGGTIATGIADSFTATPQYTLRTFAGLQGLAQLGNGTYTVTLVCRTALGSASLGDFVGQFTVSGNNVAPVTAAAAAATTTTVAASSASATWGSDVSFTVNVANSVTASDKPTGSVQLLDGAAPLGAPAPLTAGTAVVSTNTLSPGSHAITATFTSSDATKYENSTTISATSVAVTLDVPVLLRGASLTGAAQVGGTITCLTGTWSNATSYKYEFLRNGIVVQTSSSAFTRVLVPTDLGTRYACRVTASNPIGTTATPSTSPAAVVARGAAARAKVLPKLRLSRTSLLTTVGVWTPAFKYTYTYTWLRSGRAVAGQHSSSYRLTKLDKGKVISVIVYASRTGYTTGSAVSAGVRVR